MSADPEIPPAVNQQRRDFVAVQLRRVPNVKYGEAYPIEAREPFFCAQPQVSVGSLCDRHNGVLRQSRFGLPHLLGVLRQRLRRIEGQKGTGRRQQARGHEPCQQHTRISDLPFHARHPVRNTPAPIAYIGVFRWFV